MGILEYEKQPVKVVFAFLLGFGKRVLHKNYCWVREGFR
jgi:hypothetical protein